MNNFVIRYNEDKKGDRWWDVVYQDGRAIGKAFIYNSDPQSVILSDLFVQPEFRNKKYGTILQEIREKIGKDNNCEYAYLFVKKRTWQRKWYGRRGYKYYGKYIEDKNKIWLRKKIRF